MCVNSFPHPNSICCCICCGVGALVISYNSSLVDGRRSSAPYQAKPIFRFCGCSEAILEQTLRSRTDRPRF
ncbi:unnamed protein product [Calicophoron daubneyi]|uniref:Secreted protein n=1 Tax=Calicophoron daubneyi TaxID=300641 RepID=A0AAV2TUX4_CALDB